MSLFCCGYWSFCPRECITTQEGPQTTPRKEALSWMHKCSKVADSCFLFISKTSSEALLNAFCCSCYKLVLSQCQKWNPVLCEVKRPSSIVLVVVLVERRWIKFCLEYVLSSYVFLAHVGFVVRIKLLNAPWQIFSFHTLQDIHHEFKKHNSELWLLNQLVTLVWPYAEMDQGS